MKESDAASPPSQSFLLAADRAACDPERLQKPVSKRWIAPSSDNELSGNVDHDDLADSNDRSNGETGEALFRDMSFPFHGMPNPGLLNRLLVTNPSQVDAQDLGDGIAAWERLASWVKANQYAWIAELDARCIREFAEQSRGMLVSAPAGRIAVAIGRNKDSSSAELSTILAISHNEAKKRVETASALHTYLFETHDALEAGIITSNKAELLAQRLAKVDAETAIAVEASTLEVARTKPCYRFAKAVESALIAVDPEGAVARHFRARTQRRVERPTAIPDGMAIWRAVLPAEQALHAHRALTAAARNAKAKKDSRTLDQLRADILAHTLGVNQEHPGLVEVSANEKGHAHGTHAIAQQGGEGPVAPSEPHRCGYEVLVTIPASALSESESSATPPTASCDEPAVPRDQAITSGGGPQQPAHPATLTGYGPINAASARMLASDQRSRWRFAVTDDHTGRILDLARKTYRPPQDLARLVRAREEQCVFPSCYQPSVDCDLDHTQPFEHEHPTRGGQTCPANLAPLCRKHHNLKTLGLWELVQPSEGTYIWTSPLGRTHHSASPKPSTPVITVDEIFGQEQGEEPRDCAKPETSKPEFPDQGSLPPPY